MTAHTYTADCDGRHPSGPCPTRTSASWFPTTAATRNTIADRLTDDEIDRLAERVERRMAERRRAQGGVSW